MTRWKKIAKIALPVCLATGIAFALLPQTWIELWFGTDPDGGSGLFEFLMAAVPIAGGLVLANHFFKPFRSGTSRGSRKVTLNGRPRMG
jgi:hypothetical protein